MRADRLIAVLLILQTRGQVTAAEIAQELEISTRTARRDLDALAMSGIPIYSQPGRGGGWRLLGGAKTDLTGLSSDEAQALFLALGQQAETNPMLEAALRKLVVALPERFRDDAVAATSAIKVDPTGWGHIGPVHRPPYVDILSEAVIAGRQVRIRYQTPGKASRARVVHPLGLVTKRAVWYLIANTADGMRTFRLSRVESADILDAPVERPDDFDLDATWESIVSFVEQRRDGLQVRVLVHPAMLRPLRYVFANRSEVLGTVDNEWVEVQVSESSAGALAAQLAGFGNRVLVLDPPAEVVVEMARIARELAQKWLP